MLGLAEQTLAHALVLTQLVAAMRAVTRFVEPRRAAVEHLELGQHEHDTAATGELGSIGFAEDTVEAYGQVDSARSAKIATAVDKALAMTARIQRNPAKASAIDKGGWRYLYRPGSFTPSDSDLSVTGWQLMFLRSAKNARFDVPDAMVTDALKYVERCFDTKQGGFVYGLIGNDRRVTRGTMGVGALSLALGGKHHTAMARRVGDWLLQHPFDTYGQTMHTEDRFHYSAYYCSHAMAQLGGDYWKRFFPVVAKTLLDAQSADGSWDAEVGRDDAIYGPTYPTALSVLTLTPAYQLLPIYQR